MIDRAGRRRRRLWSSMVGLAMLAGCGALETGSIPPTEIPDPTKTERTGWPNDWLICRPGTCAAEASAEAPIYPVPPERLFAAWREVLAAQPRVTVIAVDDSRLLFLVQDLPADVPHQPAMTTHQGGKSRFITPARKLFE